MDKENKNIGIPIQDLMRQALGIIPGEVEVSGEVCIVKSINGILCDCSPIDGSPDLLDVRLKVSDADGVLFVPTIGSTVTVAYLNKNVAYITQYSQLDSIKFMDGSFGGLTKTLELKTQLNKNNEILSAILGILTGPPINEPGSGAPSALQAALNGVLAGKQIGDFSNIENTKITQG